MKPQNLIVFDMDGVLVDVSGSYRETIRLTARFFFEGARSAEYLPDPLFSLEDLAEIKQSGGLNNDWDLTAVVIDLLFGLVEVKKPVKTDDTWKAFEDMIRQCDVGRLAALLKAESRPLAARYRGQKTPRHSLIQSLYSGDVGSGNVIKQIFQEIYLGQTLFPEIYRMPPRIYNGQGYIFNEKLLIESNRLKALSENSILAIATGRPRAEADIPLDHFDIRQCFEIIYTLDDCLEAEEEFKQSGGQTVSFSKPHPFMLDAIADATRARTLKRFYIGDMPDDMQAAARSEAGYAGVGLVLSAPEKEALKVKLAAAGANYIVENFKELETIILSD